MTAPGRRGEWITRRWNLIVAAHRRREFSGADLYRRSTNVYAGRGVSIRWCRRKRPRGTSTTCGKKPTGAKGSTSSDEDVVDEERAYASERDLDPLRGADQSPPHDGFDAFNENTWDQDFTTVSTTPWYRSPQARTLMIASGAALSAIVVSVVLLVFRDSSAGERPVPTDGTTAVTTPLATATSEMPPPSPPSPPPPPPPPPPPQPSTMNQAPAVVQPTVRPRPTKAPEIGVTRTPATRQPMSVAPQPRRPR